MAILTLPVAQNAPWYDFTTTLDAAFYTLEMAFNTRANRWMLSIGDATGAPVLCGLPVVIERDLLAGLRYLPVPAGAIIALDQSGQRQQPVAGSFLLNHRLYYIEKGTVL